MSTPIYDISSDHGLGDIAVPVHRTGFANYWGPEQAWRAARGARRAAEKDMPLCLNYEPQERLDNKRSDDATVERTQQTAMVYLDAARKAAPHLRVTMTGVALLHQHAEVIRNVKGTKYNLWRRKLSRLGRQRGAAGRWEGRGLNDAQDSWHPQIYPIGGWSPYFFKHLKLMDGIAKAAESMSKRCGPVLTAGYFDEAQFREYVRHAVQNFDEIWWWRRRGETERWMIDVLREEAGHDA